MTKGTNLLLDAAVAGGLVLALLFVIGLDKILPQAPQEQQQPQITITPQDPPVVQPKPLRMAMTPSTLMKSPQNPNILVAWENMSEILDSLGAGYKYDNIRVEDLFLEENRANETLSSYDIIFFTCGQEHNFEPRLYGNLRKFVEKGGTLYAADWRYDCLKLAFPEYHKPELAFQGDFGNVTASVRDSGLRDVFGSNVNLHFELDQWKTAAFGGRGVDQLLWGEFRKFPPGQFPPTASAPLLVRFHHGKGTVIFTSFHNEKKNSDTSKKLLKYLIFSVVTAKESASATQSLIKGGFSPSKSNLMSASAGDPKVSHTYQHTKPGKLRFVLAFNPGAKLRLELEGPGGKKYEQTGTSTFTIEVPDAPLGEWRYTVAALQVPHENYPFTLTVAEESK